MYVQGVGVVNNYADTFGKLWRILTDFKGTTIRQYKVFICDYIANINNLKIWKSPYLKKKSGVRVVVVYRDTQFSNFAIKYLRESEKCRETIFAFSYGAKVESFKQKNGRKSLDTVPLRKLP